ncbi:MAG: methyltransferase domain-containing protein [Planctomycetaceae bacterium]|nr:methyltransferase domain-containing protein [Planctomycetaceae bacterium]
MNLQQDALPAAYWQRRYADGTTGWDRGQASPGLDWLLDRARQEQWRTVLIPGCGRGHEVIALAEAGFSVTALDYADAAIQHLKKVTAKNRLPIELVQTDVLTYDPKNRFDAIYEQTCLCALHPSLWSAYERKLAQWLRPGGSLFAMFMQTTQPQGPPFACPLGRMRELFGSETWIWSPVLGRVDHPAGLHEWACELRRAADFQA